MSSGTPTELIRKAIQADSWSDCLVWLYDLEPKIIELEADNKRLRELVRCSNCAYWIGEQCDYWEDPEKEIGNLGVCKEFRCKALKG